MPNPNKPKKKDKHGFHVNMRIDNSEIINLLEENGMQVVRETILRGNVFVKEELAEAI